MNPYKHERSAYRTFRADMAAAGYEVEEYHGRFSYQGPAVRIDAAALQDLIRATRVYVVWDQMGKDGLIVYPA